MLPENRTAPAGNGGKSNDLLAGGIGLNDTDYLALVAEAELGYVSSLLLVNLAEVGDLASIPEPGIWSDPLCGFAFLGITTTIAAGIQPSLVTVAETVRRESIEVPDALRTRLIPYLSALSTRAPLPAFCSYYRGLVRQYRANRLIVAAAERIIRATRSGSPEDLAVVAEISTTEIRDLVAVQR